MDFRDMLALAKAGSQVLHAKSVELAMANNVELELLSSFSGKRGTRLKLLKDAERPDFAGITGRPETGRISLGGKAADAGALSKAVMLLAEQGISVISGDILKNCISIETEKNAFLPAIKLLHREMLIEK
jgi:aspartate kinase